MEQPILNKNGNGNGNYEYEMIIKWFEDVSKKASSVQTQILSNILKQNHGVEYLKKWLGDYNVLEMEPCALESLFTSLVPISSHADFEPFIQRISDGDTHALLTRQPITTLSLRCFTFYVAFFFILPFFFTLLGNIQIHFRIVITAQYFPSLNINNFK